MYKLTTSQLGRPDAEKYAQMDKMPVTVILDNIRSLNNVGSVFRTADAFAVERLFLCGITATPPDREIHKTALGAENTVCWEYHKNITDAAKLLKEQGYQILALEQTDTAVKLQDFDCHTGHKYALILGNEVFGVTEDVLPFCDQSIEIPQSGTKHSLNVSVAAGVAIWHFYNRLWL